MSQQMKCDGASPALSDPRELYPKPPFKKQPQPAPGLDRKMDPVPDCGEKTYRGSGRLAGRHALITGGDSGIGRAVAIAFWREGAEVTINYLPVEQSDADDLAEVAKADGAKLHLMPGDLTDEKFARGLVHDAAKKMGSLDILVINAGKQVFQEDFKDVTSEQFDATMKTNVYAMYWHCHEALPLMPAGSSIITVASVLGYDPMAELVDYCMTKFAVRGFTRGLAKVAAKKGIRVNCIAPGWFWTVLQPSGGLSQERVQVLGEDAPMGRPGQPAEIAGSFVYLASTESSYTTGTILGVTGGVLAD